MKLRLFIFAILAAVAGALSAQDPRFSLSPNPAHQQVTLSFSGKLTSAATVEVYSVLGQRVFSRVQEAGEDQISLNTAALPEGFYLVRVTTAGQTFAKRLKIQHQ